MLRALRYYFAILGSSRRLYVGCLGGLLIVNLYQFVPPFLLGLVAQYLVDDQQARTPLMIIALLFGLSYAVVSIVRLQLKKFLAGIRTRNNHAIRQESFRKLVYLPEHAENADSGSYIQTLNQGLQAWFDFGNVMQNEGVKTVVVTAGLTVLIAYYTWPLAVLILIYVVAFYYQAQYYNTRLAELEAERMDVQSQTSATIVDTMRGSHTLKAFRLSQKIHSRTESKNEILFAVEERMRHYSFKLWQNFQCLNGIFLALAIWQVCRLSLDKSISITLTVTIIGYIQSFTGAFSEVLDVWGRLQTSVAGLHRLASIYQPAIAYDFRDSQHQTIKNWQSLKFSNICYTYPGGHRPTIDDRSIEITRGNHVLLRGPSGAGKSTFAKIIAGMLAPQSGKITLDGEPLIQDQLSRIVAYAMQETQVFNLSLKENITLCADVPEERINTVVEICRLSSLLERMPDGLDTVIGNGTWLLSGGEQLRLALSRALLLEPLVLILDETTSMIEETLETSILSDIRSTYPDITLIQISHQNQKRDWVTQVITL